MSVQRLPLTLAVRGHIHFPFLYTRSGMSHDNGAHDTSRTITRPIGLPIFPVPCAELIHPSYVKESIMAAPNGSSKLQVIVTPDFIIIRFSHS
ncbi:hypothetical protein GDO81_028531 [Engystomops pustulosus]|uniref:Uncharacterized protein n=1 Tax=Engystomops pustulosus TaxID=76066 RepID=A0AAV6YJJ2_ENGPU|nr:hypothetical protein GDO81_028531 [Engystomops pustulosus]